jgi:hypothetical protein
MSTMPSVQATFTVQVFDAINQTATSQLYTITVYSMPGPAEFVPHVLLILEGGPFDGEEQIVQDLPIWTGSKITLNMPNHQTFQPDIEEEVVVDQGIEVTYTLQGPGRAPTASDTWESSWVYEY